MTVILFTLVRITILILLRYGNFLLTATVFEIGFSYTTAQEYETRLNLDSPPHAFFYV